MDPGARAQLNRAMVRLADGDRRVFREVFAGLYPIVVRFAARVLPDGAEDVAQRVLMKVFEQASDFERDGDVVSWALAITAWEVRTFRRGLVRRKAMHAASPAASATRTPEDDALERELQGAAQAALEQLSPSDQKALREALFAADGRSQVKSPAARKRKERALDRMRRLWRSLDGQN